MRVSEAEKNAVIDRGFSETGTEDEKTRRADEENQLERGRFFTGRTRSVNGVEKTTPRRRKKSPPARSIFGPSEARHADAIPHQKETR